MKDIQLQEVRDLAPEMEALENQNSRVFRTFVSVGNLQCTLVTTSSQIQLGLSRLSQTALSRFCNLLVDESGKDDHGEGLLVRGFGLQVFVTKCCAGNHRSSFHLSRAGNEFGGGHHGGHGGH